AKGGTESKTVRERGKERGQAKEHSQRYREGEHEHSTTLQEIRVGTAAHWKSRSRVEDRRGCAKRTYQSLLVCLCVCVSSLCFHGSPEAVAAMASEPSTQSRVMFQAADKTQEPAHRKLGKLTVKYNRKDLQRRLDIEEWIDGQLHLLFDCEEEEIPELEIDIDELLELTDEGQRTRLQELLQECGKPKEDFINGLLYRIKGLRKMSGPLKK
ncbi:hypothetical protein PFLUV_G00234900, partial [Perca fluviatilis]